MGNRVYVTIKAQDTTPKRTYYLHWNGGLNTWLPLLKAVFDHNGKAHDISRILQLFGINAELQTNDDAAYWQEENGHYTIDLDQKTILVTRENGSRFIAHESLELNFKYFCNSVKYREGYYDQIGKRMWENITSEIEVYFKTIELLKNEGN